MMAKVLGDGSADYVLTSGITGQVMHKAQGRSLGPLSEKFIADRGLGKFVEPAKQQLKQHPGKLLFPLDFGVDDGGKRSEVGADELPVEHEIIDIGPRTVAQYREIIEKAGTVFVNGPAGVYEKPIGVHGTQELGKAIAEAKGYTVIGGGDTISAATQLGYFSKMSYVCTGGGALIRFLSGVKLPLVEAMRNAKGRWAHLRISSG